MVGLDSKMLNVAVIGAGFVGLTTAACIAELGNSVICVESDKAKMLSIQQGRIPFFEKNLSELVYKNVMEGRLGFVLDASDILKDADIVMLCLPTPRADDGSADISYLENFVLANKKFFQKGAVIVNKSTSPVGTASFLNNLIDRKDVTVVSNPEFMREGNAVQDFLKPDRIVIGADNLEAGEYVTKLYRNIKAPIMHMSTLSAELCKYAANGFLATKISFANEIAELCDAVGADYADVRMGFGSDRRIGESFLSPSAGWGGSCFPKDTMALLSTAHDHKVELKIVRAAVKSNDQQPKKIVNRLEWIVGDLAGKKIAVWGLAFKADTSDMRESPAFAVITEMISQGAEVVAYDPIANAKDLPWDIVKDPVEACKGADGLVILTEWSEFVGYDLHQVGAVMASRKIVDARNILDANAAIAAGFTYVGVGIQANTRLKDLLDTRLKGVKE
jgi:UDPglucose 6-dehydrogenase